MEPAYVEHSLVLHFFRWSGAAGHECGWARVEGRACQRLACRGALPAGQVRGTGLAGGGAAPGAAAAVAAGCGGGNCGGVVASGVSRQQLQWLERCAYPPHRALGRRLLVRSSRPGPPVPAWREVREGGGLAEHHGQQGTGQEQLQQGQLQVPQAAAGAGAKELRAEEGAGPALEEQLRCWSCGRPTPCQRTRCRTSPASVTCCEAALEGPWDRDWRVGRPMWYTRAAANGGLATLVCAKRLGAEIGGRVVGLVVAMGAPVPALQRLVPCWGRGRHGRRPSFAWPWHHTFLGQWRRGEEVLVLLRGLLGETEGSRQRAGGNGGQGRQWRGCARILSRRRCGWDVVVESCKTP